MKLGYQNKEVKFEELKGKTFYDIYQDGDNEIWFILADGSRYVMHHEQDCCEDVHIESIVGNLVDLIDNEILMAEEVINEKESHEYQHFTYTFYKLATVKGYVDIRWVGESNGYYSEKVQLNYLKFKNPLDKSKEM